MDIARGAVFKAAFHTLKEVSHSHLSVINSIFSGFSCYMSFSEPQSSWELQDFNM